MEDLLGGDLLAPAPQVETEKVVAIFDFDAQAEGDLGTVVNLIFSLFCAQISVYYFMK